MNSGPPIATDTLHLSWVTSARNIASLAIVALHVTAAYAAIGPGSPQWWIVNGVNVLSRFAVPMFFMLSGGLLLNSSKAENMTYVAKRTLIRVLLPTMACIVIYNIIYRYGGLRPDLPLVSGILDNQSPAHHLWFMWALCSLTLATPLLKVLFDHLWEHPAVAVAAFVIWSMYSMLGPALILLWGMHVPALAYSTIFDWTVGYYLVGGWIFRSKSTDRLPSPVFALAAGASWFLSLWLHMSVGMPSGTSLFLDGRFPGIFVLSTSMLLLFKSSAWLGNLRWSWTANSAFTLYLVHIALLDLASGLLKKTGLTGIAPLVETAALFVVVAALGLGMANVAARAASLWFELLHRLRLRT